MKMAWIAFIGAVVVAAVCCTFVLAVFWVGQNYGLLGVALVAFGFVGAVFGAGLAIQTWGDK